MLYIEQEISAYFVTTICSMIPLCIKFLFLYNVIKLLQNLFWATFETIQDGPDQNQQRTVIMWCEIRDANE